MPAILCKLHLTFHIGKIQYPLCFLMRKNIGVQLPPRFGCKIGGKLLSSISFLMPFFDGLREDKRTAYVHSQKRLTVNIVFRLRQDSHGFPIIFPEMMISNSVSPPAQTRLL